MELRLTTQQEELLRDLLQERFPQAMSPEQSAHLDSIRAAHLAELEAYTPGPELKVRVTMLPSCGQEFYFPAAPFDTKATSFSLVWLVLFCFVYFVGYQVFSNFKPGMLMIMPVFMFGVFVTVVMGVWVLGLWIAPQVVRIENGVLSRTTGLLRRTQTLPVNAITSIHAITGSLPTHSAIRICGLKFYRVGDGIRDWRDAEWVAMQMSRAAGVKPTASLPTDCGDDQLEKIQTLLSTFEGLQGKMTVRANGQGATRKF